MVNPPGGGDGEGVGVGSGAGPVKAQGDEIQMWGCLCLAFLRTVVCSPGAS